MNPSIPVDNQGALLLALGLGAVLGILFGGWIMSAVHKLLIGVVKLILLGAVVVIGLFLWKQFQPPQRPQYGSDIPVYQPPSMTAPTTEPWNHQSAPSSPSDRWWEE